MIVSLIVAVDENGGIGWKGSLPWRLSADQKHFKAITMGHYLLMGRRTYESIGRPLPGRKMILVTHQENYIPSGCNQEDCHVVRSLEAGFDLARQRGETELFIIGGAAIYEKALPYADRLYLTTVHTRAARVDIFMPVINMEEWQETINYYHPADDANEYPFTFRQMEKIRVHQPDSEELEP